jgi:hypothetical protein
MNTLPAGFESLEPFVDQWAVSGLANRAQRRDESSPDERLTFYEAGKNLVGTALDHLDRKTLGQLDAREKRLMNLMLSFAHVALAVELQGDAESGHAQLRPAMRITQASADRPVFG